MGEENCILCQIISGKIPSKKIYEDEDALAILDINGANIGHCFIFPKKHYPIFEQVPDHEAANLFKVANAVSSSIFETLKIEGTNIFVSNGVAAGQTVAHFVINVIPRREGDGINLQWQPKQLNEEEMSTIEIKLKAETEGGHRFEEKKQEEKPKQVREETEILTGEENYLVKQLRRIP
ncbi:HIT domain-containing protein [Candidatus Woesearchaeota archaeon]|nr:HIT domain-containing protein [Candidatus Woesearchaeota archaeon]